MATLSSSHPPARTRPWTPFPKQPSTGTNSRSSTTTRRGSGRSTGGVDQAGRPADGVGERRGSVSRTGEGSADRVRGIPSGTAGAVTIDTQREWLLSLDVLLGAT